MGAGCFEPSVLGRRPRLGAETLDDHGNLSNEGYMTRITVLYLWRKVNDPRYAHAFFKSLEKYPAGTSFRFVFAAKGYQPGDRLPVPRLIPGSDGGEPEILHFSDEKTPISVYRAVSEQCGTELVLCFNSWSRILAPGWLSAYLRAFDATDHCGLVGASGGYETVWEQPFPNVGIRSNAFLIPTALFNALEIGTPASVGDDHRLEAGPASLTKQVMARGLQAVIVDRDGIPWLAGDWPNSRTFRLQEQEGLLIADNRTNQYACGSRRKRKRLVSRCWGAEAKATPGTPWRKLAAWLAWNYPRGPVDMIPDALANVEAWVCRLRRVPPKPRRTVFPN